MQSAGAKPGTRRQKIGWGILLVISGLMLGNGVMWFFIGPAQSSAYAGEIAGFEPGEFEARYPEVTTHQGHNARQVAIWYAAFGTMAMIVALEGWRHGSRWAWTATWLVPAAPIGIGLVYQGVEGMFLITAGAIAAAGQLLARST